MAAADIAAELRRLAPHSDTSFVLDTLEYMWKGGRCSGVAALGANMLKLKPCLEMREGKLVVCKKYRGSMDKVYRQYIAERLAGKAVVADHALHHPLRRGAGGDAVAADGAGAGAGPLRGGIRHSGGLHGFLPLRPGHAGRAVPAEGVTKPEIGSRRAPAHAGAVWVCVMGEEGEKTFHRSCDPSLNKV